MGGGPKEIRWRLQDPAGWQDSELSVASTLWLFPWCWTTPCCCIFLLSLWGPGELKEFLMLNWCAFRFPGNYFVLKASCRRANCTRLKEGGNVICLPVITHLYMIDAHITATGNWSKHITMLKQFTMKTGANVTTLRRSFKIGGQGGNNPKTTGWKYSKCLHINIEPHFFYFFQYFVLSWKMITLCNAMSKNNFLKNCEREG